MRLELLDAHTDWMRWVGLVRNIMLGREGIDRAGLIAIVQDAGGSDVRSHLTTGNVTFEAGRSDIAGVIDRAQGALADLLARETPLIVRELEWLRGFVGVDPFAGFDPHDWELEVGLLPHDAEPVSNAMLPPSGRTHIVAVHDRELVTARPRTGPDRPHVNVMLEKATGRLATARGWSTLRRIAGV